MPYTTQGFMTAEDVAETRADMDLDLCAGCEEGTCEIHCADCLDVLEEHCEECQECSCSCDEDDHA